MVTVAPAMGLPSLSVIVPRASEDTVWAPATDASVSAKTSVTSLVNKILAFIVSLLLFRKFVVFLPNTTGRTRTPAGREHRAAQRCQPHGVNCASIELLWTSALASVEP